MTEVLIIGGGASGMMAALSASESKENKVTIIERQPRLGRKLAATGNGRCNLSNLSGTAQSYHGQDPAFAQLALAAFSPEATLDFFASLGLLTVTEYGGRVFPMSGRATSVLDALRFAMEARGVKILTDCAAVAASKNGNGLKITHAGGAIFADKLIVACGSLASEKLGGVRDGYDLLKSFGHSCTKLYPALTQLKTAPEYPRALKGIKAVAHVTIKKSGKTITENQGEVLFTDTGVSGTAIFEVSRFVSAQGGSEVVLDFFPSHSDAQLLEYLKMQRQNMVQHPANRVLTGSVHSKLGQMLCKAAGIGAQVPCEELSPDEISRLCKICKAFSLEITGVSGFEAAQVAAGGIKTSEFNPKTMQSRLVKNLYACGETLDIDGDCGGYNLQWAWSSGHLAGRIL